MADIPTISDCPSGLPRGAARVFQVTVAASPSLAEAVTVTLDPRPVTVGREPGPGSTRSLALADDQASRRHAEIAYDAATDAFSIRDLDSRNGTFVDGRRVTHAPLVHGAVVRIGRSLLVCADHSLRPDDPLTPEEDSLRGLGLAMQRVRGEIARVAPRALPVLVLGETGTGKELVAREVHRRSGRSGPFIAVNCAALPESLAESELFGHAQGAFTGAVQRTDGFYAAAHGGTLFLDEVAELNAGVQAKLLRALASGEVQSLGKSSARTVDVRVVAATHRDVFTEPAFRADLRARLAGWTIRLPPLRERREDVLWLTRIFAEREKPPVSVATSAAEALLLYDWPGNVRELEMVVAAAAVRCDSSAVIRSDHLPDAIAARVASRTTTERPEPPLELLVARDRPPSPDDLRLVLERFGGNIARAAEYFGKDRKQVYRWLERG